jgi:hypothetical protein
MIKKWYNIWKSKRETEARLIESINILAQAKVVAENVELRTICINNVSYIESYINTLSANINHAKGSNAAATNRKRKSMRERIDWLKSKLTEEKSMVEYYSSLI